MNITALGISHKTASIEIREKFYLRETERELFLSELKNEASVVEAFVISTCNRTEIYAGMIDHKPNLLRQLLFKIKNLPESPESKKYFYTHSGEAAVDHLLRVSAGLDSLVLGEKQILGQVKFSVDLARKHGMLSSQFNILSNLAIRLGKKARTETDIDYGGCSVSWAAVRTAKKRLGTLEDKVVLIIGAGKMGKLTASNLENKGIGHIYVVNRTHEKAAALANQVGGVAVSFWEMDEILKEVDVCICAADAPHFIVDKKLIEKVVPARGNKEMLFIDISTPRNIDPEIAYIDNVSLIAIDDLDKAIEDNLSRRSAAVSQVEEMISAKISEFLEKLAKRQAMSVDRVQGTGDRMVVSEESSPLPTESCFLNPE